MHSTLHDYSSSDSINLASICHCLTGMALLHMQASKAGSKTKTAGQANLEPGSNCSQHNPATQDKSQEKYCREILQGIVVYFFLCTDVCVCPLSVQFKNTHSNAIRGQRLKNIEKTQPTVTWMRVYSGKFAQLYMISILCYFTWHKYVLFLRRYTFTPQHFRGWILFLFTLSNGCRL